MHPDAMMRRTDVNGNSEDSYGKHYQGTIPYQVMKGSPYEITWKHGVPVSDFWYVVVPNNIKQELIKRLESKGIFSINGIPLDTFILTTGQSVPQYNPAQWSSGMYPSLLGAN
jgi:hypothetical protein